MIKIFLNKIQIIYFVAFFLPVSLFAAPITPSHLQLHALSSHSVMIQWEDNSDNESGFKIFRDGELIHTTISNVTSYIDEGLSPAKEYTYTIKSTDSLTRVKPKKLEYQPFEPIDIVLEGMSGDATDWIAIFPLGAQTHWDDVINWTYTNGIIDGNITMDGIAVGQYDVRAFFKDSYIVESIAQFNVIAPDDKISIETSKLTYREGEDIVVHVDGMLGDKEDWVGIYPLGSSNEWDNVLSWKFTDGVITGDIVLNTVVAGEYEVRVFFKNSFILEAKKAFTVTKEENRTKLFLIGDSTVYNDSEGEQGWGSAFGTYLWDDQAVVINQARSGASSKSYLNDSASDHDWKNTAAMIESSENSKTYLFIQFGHNDEKADETLHTDPGRGKSYYNYLKYYVDEARKIGAIPVLITPVERMYINHRDHGLYPQTVRDLAEDESVVLIDLEEQSFNEFALYESNEALWAIFDHDDHTHFNPEGAKIVAGWVRDLICNTDSKLCENFQQ